MNDVVNDGMNDDDLGGIWTTLEPTMRQRRRIDARVFEWIEARETRLASEWIGLFRVAPFSTIGLVAASAIALATAPPLIWFAVVLI